MELVPGPADQRWLLDALGRVIRTRGYETFVRGPIVEPTRKFFPDSWQFHGSAYGLAPAQKGFLNPVGEWNTQEIYLKKNHLVDCRERRNQVRGLEWYKSGV